MKNIKQIKKHRLTQQIFKLLNEKNVINVGLTTITLSTKKEYKILAIDHSGNMGNSIKRSVDPNLKRIGLPTISELKSIYDVIDERGSPDYYYSIDFDIDIYKSQK